MTAGLVLAAGAGRRYGMPKALVRHAGRLLVERAVDTLREAGSSPIVVVLGAAHDQVPELPGDVVINPDWATGMASSLKAGLRALEATGAEAAVVLLVDMPGVSAEAVRRVSASASADALVMGGYGERRGHPVLLGRNHWAGVAATAEGDSGARNYLRAHAGLVRVVAVGDVSDDLDLDVPELDTHA
ncbi:nucleotidyltransferase family protein [Paractinoplanes atraurantiacus]|uniref:Nicotine blue oxidoreductase n=1 Tax=Paractinoplanes atraurantiacus TaxID=1036182 RepID=A0A285JD00_9ACTN|nr:nucleotidyltransferase family protein [Actinoplanes atraurantiacus]SNY57717.1 nicotine blue oxidoreductase [Actinoplanes atraurantiacus]